LLQESLLNHEEREDREDREEKTALFIDVDVQNRGGGFA
jgi:hypothetical protein